MTGNGWRLLFAELRPYRSPLRAVAVLSVVLALPTALSGLVIAHALDNGFLVQQVGLGLLWLALLGLLLLASATLTWALFPFLVRVTEPLRDRLVTAVVTASLEQALSDLSPATGATVVQVTDEVEAARRLVIVLLRNIHNTISVALGALIGLTTLNPLAGLIVLPSLAAIGTVYRVVVRVTLRRQRHSLLREEDLARNAARMFTSRRDIVACTAEQTAARPVRAAIESTRRASLSLARLGAVRTLTVGLGTAAATLLLLVVLPILVADGEMSSGDLVAAVFYMAFGLGPAVQFLIHSGGGWLTDLVSVMSRLDEIVTAPATVDAGHDATAAPPAAGPSISLQDITFAYSPTAEPVLREMSVDITYGDHIAIVGPSGSGKSTFAALVSGLRRPDHGVVLLGGADLATLTEQQRCRAVALVPQEAYVFAGTLRENLCYQQPAALDPAVRDAAELFGLHDVLRRHGLDGELSHGGAGLSAGERQLISLARTYLSAAPIVILDEATSHLDPMTERRAETLFIKRGGTLVVIAHRISSAQRAERVMLVESGHVTIGTHHTLLEISPRYRELSDHWNPDPREPWIPARSGGSHRDHP